MNDSNITKITLTNVPQILFNVSNYISASINCNATGVTADANGKKILKAGTPMAGDITKRDTPFSKGTETNSVGVLMHDVDVTNGNGNGALLLQGAVNLDRLDSTVKPLITTAMSVKLHRLLFLSDH